VSETTFSVYEPYAWAEEAPTPFESAAAATIAGQRTRTKLAAAKALIDDALESLALEPLVAPRPAEAPAVVPLRLRVLNAIDDIRTTLGIAESAAANLVRVARNTLASWRRGERDPYPATVRTIFEVHSVVAAANALLGTDGARQWFHEFVGDQTRLESLGTEGGVAALTAQLRGDLFPRRRRSALDDISDDADNDAANAEFAAGVFDGPPVIARRVP
jgi:hypothetical protein